MDTGAWYALEVQDDIQHRKARQFLAGLASGKYGVSITTDYVLDETLTLLRSRRSLKDAATFIEKIRTSKSVKVFWVDDALFEKALEIFQGSQDKSWSFTDCTSFALMNELSVPDSFAFDSHFKEAGFNILP
ncbi:MAG: type II toxin-antitoxin system VapC family toxin [Nitrososphaerales archaeon]